MQKSRPAPGVESEALPPPYSSVVSAQEYGMRPPVSATAPYPVTPDSEQTHNTVPMGMGMPPPYYYYNPMPMGTTGSMIPALHSTPNITFTPAIYNPVNGVTPITQRRTRGSWIKNFVSTICVMLVVVVIITIMGLGIQYYIQEVF